MISTHPAPALSVLSRITGVIRAPRRTFRAVAAAPRYFDVLAIAFVAAFGASALMLETETGELALLDQWERTAIAFGRTVDDQLYADMLEASGRGTMYALASTAATGTLLTLVVSTFVWTAFRDERGERPAFRQVFAIAAHAAVIPALRQVVAAPVAYVRETLASPFTLNGVAPALDESSPAARLLALFDLFALWWLVALAVGVAVLYRRSVRRVALAFLAVYGVAAGALGAAMALLGSRT